MSKDLRTQALRDAYWAHREVPGRHRGECCQDPCFEDIVERWVTLVSERIHDNPAEAKRRGFLA